MGGQQSKGFKAQCTNVLIGHDDTVTCCAFSSNEKYLATCSTDKKVLVWDYLKNKIVHQFLGHKDAVNCCSFSPNNKVLLTVGNDKLIIVWDLEKGVLKRRYGVHESAVTFCTFAPSNDFVFATCSKVRFAQGIRIDLVCVQTSGNVGTSIRMLHLYTVLKVIQHFPPGCCI